MRVEIRHFDETLAEGVEAYDVGIDLTDACRNRIDPFLNALAHGFHFGALLQCRAGEFGRTARRKHFGTRAQLEAGKKRSDDE